MDVSAKTVLVVDDNAHVRYGLRQWLENSANLKVCGEAADGSEAVTKALKEKPNLILMDLSMPEMNGIEAAAAIRRQLPGARIVIFTLFADLIGKAVAKFAGVDLILPKTEGTDGLLKALSILLTDPSPEGQN